MNYYEKTTSNYFHVKDANAFQNQIKELGLEDFFEPNEDYQFCLVCEGMCVETGDDEYFLEDDFAELIRSNIRPDQKCFISQIGNEGYRYFTAGLWRIMPYKISYHDLFQEKSQKYNNGKWLFE